MKILFYIEPYIEKSIAGYRKHSLFIDQHAQARSLLSNNTSNEVQFIISDAIIYSTPDYEKKKIAGVKYNLIKQEELKEIFPNAKIAAHKLYHNEYSEDELSKIEHLYKTKLGDFVPDIIIAFESITTHLQKIFPDTLILTQFFSVFSRYPFPRLHCFDPFGIYKDTYMVRYKDELNNLELSDEKTNFMNAIREKYFDDILFRHDPTFSIIKEKREEFDKIILLPLQGSNYFAFEENHDCINLFDYICDVMDRVDPRLGVLITEHTARERVVNDGNIDYLRNKYPNFIYFEEFNDIKFHSQFLLKHVDGCAFVTSAVGLMSSLLKKPTFQIGYAESFASSANKPEDIYQFLQENTEVNKDAAFFHLFNSYYLSDSDVKDPNKFSNFIKESLKKYKNNKVGFEYFSSDYKNSKEILQNILDSERETEMYNKNTRNALSLYGNVNPVVKRIRDWKGEYVSFDIFDTLLARPFHLPRMVFSYIEKEARIITGNPKFLFAKFRGRIEKDIRKAKIAEYGYWKETSLDEIYHEMGKKFNLSDDIIEKLKNLEIEAEMQLCNRRDSIYDAYKEAQSLGKKIIIITDFYFDKETIAKLLNKKGYSNYHRLFVSSEYGVMKKDGKLFEYLIKNEGLRPEETLHIGDNRTADIKNGNQYGLETFLTPKAMDKFFGETQRNLTLWENGINKSLLNSAVIGSVANLLFDDIRHESFAPKTLFNGSAYNLGLYGLAPMLVGFAVWLYKNAKQNNISTLYFLSREGKIMKEVYDIVTQNMENAAKSEYLLCSRRAMLVASIKDFDDIISTAFNKTISVPLSYIFENKLGVNPELIDEDKVKEIGFRHKHQMIDYHTEFSQLKELLKAHEEIILDSAAKERAAYLEYLKTKGLEVKSDSKNTSQYALVDIGYAGTMQSLMSDLLGQKLHGYYLFTHSPSKITDSSMIFRGFLFENDHHLEEEYKNEFNKYLPLLEILLSATDGSLVKFSNEHSDLKPEYWYSDSEESRIKITNDINDGIIAYSKYITKIFDKELISMQHSPNFLTKVMLEFFKNPAYKDAMILNGIKLENKIGYNKSVQLIPSKNDLEFSNLIESKANLLKNCRWTEGSKVVINKAIHKDTNIGIEKNIKKVENKAPKSKLELEKTMILEKRLNKLVNNPEMFWRDLQLKPMLLIKPLLKSHKSRVLFRRIMLRNK